MNGFKVVHHYMTALPYATPEDDMKMLKTVYGSHHGRPHEIKIYPYSVVDYSSFRREYEEGKFTLYSDEEPEKFKEVMRYALEMCPRDIRICRAVRDIPTTYILGGCKTPNLRQIITDDLAKKGRECNDMRSREISRRDTYSLEDAVYFTSHDTPNDILITLESRDRRALFGFLRLRINYSSMAQHVVFPELICGAIIEELHVYSTQGMLVKVGDKKVGASQHCGVGKELLRRAEWIAWYRGLESIAVISGEGVREYYRARGYELAEGDGRFMIKKFEYVFTPEIVMVFTVFCAMIMGWMLNLIL
jgi:ELP3 family radical SAM enzyme/protein acetyltransferase